MAVRGKRRRWYPEPPKEGALQEQVAKVLNALAGSPKRPKFVWFHVPNGEDRNIVTAAALKRMGVLAGVWDIPIFGPGGRIFLLEMKRPTKTGELRKPLENKLSDEQVAFRRALIGLGMPAERFAVADSIDGVTAALKKWGLI